ncbi:hypothetical protein J4Q44_G00186480 [Coregonus suidteri]|uniref:KID domain-containing protein n=1 Tax=Coregonus suidteri TaxID=861788 RepID=A0AAN8QTU1_9TELE
MCFQTKCSVGEDECLVDILVLHHQDWTWVLRGQRLEPSTPTIISDESDLRKTLSDDHEHTAVASSQQDGSVDDSLSDEEPSQSESNSPTAVLTQVSGTGDSAGMTVSPQMQTVQITSVAGLEGGESAVTDTQKRREILSRRPSYRKILNELSSDSSSIPRIEEEKPEDESPPSSVPSVQVPTSIYQTSCGQYIAITQGGAIQIASPGSEDLQGLQSLAMSNSGSPQILQYAAQAGDSGQQFFSVQGGQVVIQEYMAVTGDETESAATGDMPAYQLRSPTSGLPQGLVMAASPGSMSMHSPPGAH